MIPTIKNHIDGDWWTSEYSYKNWKLILKMKEGRNTKIHAINNDKVIFTLRWYYKKPDIAVQKAINHIEANYSKLSI
jgi:hypothetical protein